MKVLLAVVLWLFSVSAVASEACDIAARYAGLGFIDAKNGTAEKNRLEEIKSRLDKDLQQAAIAGMRLGRVLYGQNPNANQGEIEHSARMDCQN